MRGIVLLNVSGAKLILNFELANFSAYFIQFFFTFARNQQM